MWRLGCDWESDVLLLPAHLHTHFDRSSRKETTSQIIIIKTKTGAGRDPILGPPGLSVTPGPPCAMLPTFGMHTFFLVRDGDTVFGRTTDCESHFFLSFLGSPMNTGIFAKKNFFSSSLSSSCFLVAAK